MKLKTKFLLIASIIITLGLFNAVTGVYNTSIGLYNTSISYQLEYARKTQELVSFYDAKYLAFSQKENIANVNKDVFITVSTIIMSNRRDGQALAWKWVHENQNIPFEEFTSFYRELSAFVTEQYSGVFELEREKQLIVNKHNELISLYPNNFYNRFFLHIPPMVYKYGFVSDATRSLFKIE